MRLGNYILREPIGRGAFAEVWKATHHERPDRIYAVKVALAPGFRKQLQREGALPDLSHPGIVPLLDADTRSEIPYVVMPFLAGGSLADLLAAHPQGLPEPRVATLMEEVLSALSEAHSRGIVHRDLKPRNILLDENGRAFLSDFGLCLDLSPAGGKTVENSLSVEQRGDATIAGTLSYMAPEVLEGRPATPASDVYSAGLLLFEMLAGRRPSGLEKPSDARAGLERAFWWDSLYYWSVHRKEERYPDGASMREALLHGPRPAPIVAAVEPAPLAAPAAAPTAEDPWEDLALRWEESKTWAEQLGRLREETLKPKLEIFAEHRPEIRDLRAQEMALDAKATEARDRLRGVCDGILESLRSQADSLDSRRQSLVASGCLPKHPEVAALDRDLARVDERRRRVRELQDGSGSPVLVPLLQGWKEALRRNDILGFEEYLALAGAPELDNPWAGPARARLKGLRDARDARYGCLFLALLAVGAAAGALLRHHPWGIAGLFAAGALLVQWLSSERPKTEFGCLGCSGFGGALLGFTILFVVPSALGSWIWIPAGAILGLALAFAIEQGSGESKKGA
jgi:serine/threonine protein kinase